MNHVAHLGALGYSLSKTQAQPSDASARFPVLVVDQRVKAATAVPKRAATVTAELEELPEKHHVTKGHVLYTAIAEVEVRVCDGVG